MTRETTLNVLYIAGVGRSGSTLLGDVLGLLPSVLHVGEARGVYDYTTIPDNMIRCSCGRSYEQCEFWNPLFQTLYGDNWRMTFRTREFEGNMPRSIALPWLAVKTRFQKKIPVQSHLLETFRDLVDLLRCVSNRMNASTIVDSSKSGSFGWMLAQQPGVRLVAVHLVRDPRATVFSWTTRAIPLPVRDPLTGWRAIARVLSPRQAILHWLRSEGSAWLMRLLGVPYLRVRYESFVHKPAESISRITEFIREHGLPLGDERALVDDLIAGRAVLGEHHLIGSNPGVKSRAGTVNLKEDKAWLRETPHITRLLWTIIFLPWLLWYGYDLWPHDA